MNISITYTVNYYDKVIVKLLNYLSINYPDITITLLKQFDYNNVCYCLKLNNTTIYQSIYQKDENIIFNKSIGKINYYLKYL